MVGGKGEPLWDIEDKVIFYSNWGWGVDKRGLFGSGSPRPYILKEGV